MQLRVSTVGACAHHVCLLPPMLACGAHSFLHRAPYIHGQDAVQRQASMAGCRDTEVSGVLAGLRRLVANACIGAAHSTWCGRQVALSGWGAVVCVARAVVVQAA
jgi:hypothetical protein